MECSQSAVQAPRKAQEHGTCYWACNNPISTTLEECNLDEMGWNLIDEPLWRCCVGGETSGVEGRGRLFPNLSSPTGINYLHKVSRNEVHFIFGRLLPTKWTKNEIARNFLMSEANFHPKILAVNWIWLFIWMKMRFSLSRSFILGL